MKIILIRHGDAGAYTQPDSERALSPLGQAQAGKTGQWLIEQQDKIGKIDCYITSPYLRARQTQGVIADTIVDAVAPVLIYDGITPDDDARLAVQGLAELIPDALISQDGTVAIVCHMNIIAHMAGIITGQAPSAFALAEARIYDGFMNAGMADEVSRYTPAV